MKIGFAGVDLPEGKTRYEDENLQRLQEKDSPKKVSPYFAEFIKDEFVHCDAIVIPADAILDLLILDMEKIETRMSRVTDDPEREVLGRAMEALEEEIPLCDMDLTPEETAIVEAADPLSLKPVVSISRDASTNDVIALALAGAAYTFFYTSGPTESHAWLIQAGSDMVTCASKIHSDLARGFIRAEVVGIDDYLSCHNFNDCRSKGVVRQAERDNLLGTNEVIEFKFNV